MKNKCLLLIIGMVLSLGVFSQETKSELSFYNGNRLAFGLFTSEKFYPEIQIESDNLEVQDARYSLLIRNNIPAKEFEFSWGLGYSYSDINDSYAVLPIGVKKTNLLNQHISLNVGLELASDFSEIVRIKPLIGIGISF